jgi:hypothetical protein
MTAKNEKENNVSIHPPPHGARPGPPAEARASSTSADSHTVTRHTLAHDWVTLTPVSTRRDLIGLEPRSTRRPANVRLYVEPNTRSGDRVWRAGVCRACGVGGRAGSAVRGSVPTRSSLFNYLTTLYLPDPCMSHVAGRTAGCLLVMPCLLVPSSVTSCVVGCRAL